MGKNMKKHAILTLSLLFLLVVSSCKTKGKGEKDFVMGKNGLVMNFVQNFPQDTYIVGDADELIQIAIDIWNKGSYPLDNDEGQKNLFKNGIISISGYDPNIIKMEKNKANKELAAETFNDPNVYLPPASPFNPNGGIYTSRLSGNIDKGIIVTKYEPTILATVCYPYFTLAAPNVCIDPQPFDTAQDKVCTIGSQTLEPQGAPITITRIDQEASRGKIRFKISIENVGTGDVIWTTGKEDTLEKLIDRCTPNYQKADTKMLDRKDFDKVQLDEVNVAGKELWKTGKCTPFTDGTNNVIRLFDKKAFIVCTLDVDSALEGIGIGAGSDIQSAFTTPLSIKLSYAYKSTISKKITIKKLD